MHIKVLPLEPEFTGLESCHIEQLFYLRIESLILIAYELCILLETLIPLYHRLLGKEIT